MGNTLSSLPRRSHRDWRTPVSVYIDHLRIRGQFFIVGRVERPTGSSSAKACFITVTTFLLMSLTASSYDVNVAVARENTISSVSLTFNTPISITGKLNFPLMNQTQHSTTPASICIVRTSVAPRAHVPALTNPTVASVIVPFYDVLLNIDL